MKKYFALILLGATASAQANVYQCEQDNKVIFSQFPCDSDAGAKPVAQSEKLTQAPVNANADQQLLQLQAAIKTVPDYPVQGILFRDVTSLLEDADAFAYFLQSKEENNRELAEKVNSHEKSSWPTGKGFTEDGDGYYL